MKSKRYIIHPLKGVVLEVVFLTTLACLLSPCGNHSCHFNYLDLYLESTCTWTHLRSLNAFFFEANYFTTLYWFLPYTDMNPPWVYMCSPSWIPLPPPSHPIPLGHPSAPAPRTLSHASNLDWQFISHMIIYMFQCQSPKPSHPHPLPQSPLFYTSVPLLLSRIQGYRYHLSKFHIYVLVYCIGVFLSGLLLSV